METRHFSQILSSISGLNNAPTELQLIIFPWYLFIFTKCTMTQQMAIAGWCKSEAKNLSSDSVYHHQGQEVNKIK